eukprot:1035293-Rhodomonas_salina.2
MMHLRVPGIASAEMGVYEMGVCLPSRTHPRYHPLPTSGTAMRAHQYQASPSHTSAFSAQYTVTKLVACTSSVALCTGVQQYRAARTATRLPVPGDGELRVPLGAAHRAREQAEPDGHVRDADPQPGLPRQARKGREEARQGRGARAELGAAGQGGQGQAAEAQLRPVPRMPRGYGQDVRVQEGVLLLAHVPEPGLEAPQARVQAGRELSEKRVKKKPRVFILGLWRTCVDAAMA